MVPKLFLFITILFLLEVDCIFDI